eukprot:4590961-Amphidinium_carterae.1
MITKRGSSMLSILLTILKATIRTVDRAAAEVARARVKAAAAVCPEGSFHVSSSLLWLCIQAKTTTNGRDGRTTNEHPFSTLEYNSSGSSCSFS